MSQLIGIAAVISAVSTAASAVTWANIHPFSFAAYGFAVIAVAMGVFGGYAFAVTAGASGSAGPQVGGRSSAPQEPGSQKGGS